MTTKSTAHRISIDTKPGRAPAPIRSRYECSCGSVGPWTTPTKAHAAGDAHLAIASEAAQ